MNAIQIEFSMLKSWKSVSYKGEIIATVLYMNIITRDYDLRKVRLIDIILDFYLNDYWLQYFYHLYSSQCVCIMFDITNMLTAWYEIWWTKYIILKSSPDIHILVCLCVISCVILKIPRFYSLIFIFFLSLFILF